MALNGKDILIYLGSNVIAGTKSNEITTACDTIEVSSPTTGVWRKYIAGRKDWDVSTSWLLAATSDLASLLNVGQTYTLYIKDSGSNTILQGDAICTQAKITATIGNLLNGSFAFKGCTELAAPPSS